MCYLRNFKPIHQYTVPTKDGMVKQEQTQYMIENGSDNYLPDFSLSYKKCKQTSIDIKARFLLDMLIKSEENSRQIENLKTKINLTHNLLDEMELEKTCLKRSEPTISSISCDESSFQQLFEKNKKKANDQLLTKRLFGKSQCYKYKLAIKNNFPQQIFKQRNFSFSLNLTDQNGQKIQNSNVIDLCLAVCDVNGNWITQTRINENFLKGKTETQLLHGQASFIKIYSRDVSRYYAQGKLNMVIYPKESVLKYYEGTSSSEIAINSGQIQPLIIKDLVIKAKKN